MYAYTPEEYFNTFSIERLEKRIKVYENRLTIKILSKKQIAETKKDLELARLILDKKLSR